MLEWITISVNSIPLPPYMATEDRMILTVNWYFIGSVNSIPLPPYMATDERIRLRVNWCYGIRYPWTIKFLPYRKAGVSSLLSFEKMVELKFQYAKTRYPCHPIWQLSIEWDWQPIGGKSLLILEQSNVCHIGRQGYQVYALFKWC